MKLEALHVFMCPAFNEPYDKYNVKDEESVIFFKSILKLVLIKALISGIMILYICKIGRTIA
jgi:hypothetical protein